MKKAGSRNSRLTVTLSILVNKYIFVIQYFHIYWCQCIAESDSVPNYFAGSL